MIDLERATLFPVKNKVPLVAFGSLEPGEKVFQEGTDVALVTGEKSGVIVLDIDHMDVTLPGPVPDTFAVQTKRGLHLYFQHPGFPVPTLTKFPLEGVDLRGDRNGYVVLQAEGYQVQNDLTPAPCPDWQIEALAAYQLRREQKPSNNLFVVDVTSEFGARMLQEATKDARQLDVGPPGARDQALFDAAHKIVRVRGIPPEIAAELLLTHYCPRVPEESKDTVSEARVKYKCQEAAVEGTWEFLPFTDDDVERWFLASEAAFQDERRKMFQLKTPQPPQEVSPGYSPKRSQDMVPMSKLSKVDTGNLVNILSTNHEWAGRLLYDEFCQEYRVKEPPVAMENLGFFTRDDVTGVQLWLSSSLGLLAGAQSVESALMRVAKDHPRHPVREYLRALPPCEDPRSVLEDFAVIGLGASDPLVVKYVGKFLVGAVRRVLQPGCKMDGVLVLKGPQNTGKSSQLYALSPNPKWVQESLPDLEHKDAQEALRGHWLVEIAELQAIMRKGEGVVKDYLTRQVDSYRRPYDRGTTKTPRQCVFIATTNDDVFLRDPTGARRYWIVETDGVNLEWVTNNRDTIWSAALQIAGTGENHQLTREEIQQMSRVQKSYQEAAADPWLPSVVSYLEGKDEVRLDDVYLDVFHGAGPVLSDQAKRQALFDYDRRAQQRLAAVMRQAGWSFKFGQVNKWTRDK